MADLRMRETTIEELKQGFKTKEDDLIEAGNAMEKASAATVQA